ncbi:MAG TPA: acetolactate synthase large subunit [Candidatus Dormibacteraeota bacterium]|nr:acetolactate synthase large subunit [Candidatus Dormibacteraeota bacterium]
MKTTGAHLITRLLERQGIDVIAGIPGGASLPLYDALRASRIRHVLARHEQGAGFIAQGIARATGRPAVCFGTSGPGATNLLTAIADAKLDSIPLVAITGQVPRAMIGSDAFQEIDTYGLTVPITKHNYLVRSAAELLEVIPDAFRVAMSGRPGPVVVDVPKDVQSEALAIDAWPEPGCADPPPAMCAEDLVRAAALINEARRPMLLIGAGIITANASTAVRALAEAATIPVAATLLGLGAMPTDHPLFLGMVGMHAARCTNLALEECDLLIALGIRFDDRATGKATEFCPRARILHVDIDPSELGKIKQPFLGIEAEVGAWLRALLPDITPQRREEWSQRVQALRAASPLATPGTDDPLQPYGIVRQTAALAGDAAIVTSDVGQHQMWAAQAFPFTFARQWLTSGGLGTMGFGLPAAIGAALAHPERTVVCFTGDGSLLMNVQELATAAEEGTNVKIVLLNNGHLGLVRQQQQLFYGARYHASRFRAEPDFVAIARGFGVAAHDLGAARDPLAVLASALRERGPCLVNVPIAADANVYPMVPPGGANRDMIDGGTHAQLDA